MYIGIDGGGTKTKCVLTNESLEILYETKSGPSNFLTIGTDTVSKTILNLVTKTCNAKNVSPLEIKGIAIGTTGAGRISDAKNLESAVIQLAKKTKIPLNSFKVESDARIALEGAFAGSTGSILIAGTGSIMFGKDKSNIIHRVGGFGRLIGDEGSGLTIGTKGLNLVSKDFDGRGKSTLLTKYLETEFKISNQSELIIKVYSNELKIQDVAPLVIKAAENQDKLCLNIINEQADELVSHISAMEKKLNENAMKLVFIGGTITHENIYSNTLKKKINQNLTNIILQQPDYPPEIGAVIMAKQNSNYEK